MAGAAVTDRDLNMHANPPYVDLGRSAGCPLGTELGVTELPGRGDRHGDVFRHADVVPAS